jgi:site-specific recombinase XerD
VSVYKNKNGTWSVTLYDLHGRRKEKRFKRKSDADAFETQNKNLKRDQRLVQSNLKKATVLIEKAADEFLLSKPELRKKSKVKYENIVLQFKIFCQWKKIKMVSDFNSDHATEFFNEILKNAPQPKTVNGYLSLIRSLFRNEMLKGHIVKNPFDHVKNLRVNKKTPDYYTKTEIDLFFKQEMKEEYRNAFICFLNTGMRFEELANLTWDDIDLEKRLIKVQSKGDFRTKTFNSERSIPMTNPLYNLLKKLYVNKAGSAFPFPAPKGDKLKERCLLRVCKKIGEKASIKSRVYIHKFRHTFASHLIQRGVAIEAIQKLLGHSSINETMIYACLKPEGLHQQISVLDDLMK